MAQVWIMWISGIKWKDGFGKDSAMICYRLQVDKCWAITFFKEELVFTMHIKCYIEYINKEIKQLLDYHRLFIDS